MDMTQVNKIIDTASIDMGLRKTFVSDEEANKRLESEATIYAKHFIDILPAQIRFSPESVFDDIKDGVVLGYILHSIKKSCIDITKLVTCTNNVMDKKFIYEATTNIGYVLSSAKKIGIRLVNIGAEDIIFGNRSLILGFLWQLVRLSVSKNANVLRQPELINLKKDNESIEDLCNRTPEEMCLRWINYHLKKAKDAGLVDKIEGYIRGDNTINDSDKEADIQAVFLQCFKSEKDHRKHVIGGAISNESSRVPEKCTNFSSDLKDSKIYLILLKNVVPDLISDENFINIWCEIDLYKRAKSVLEISKEINCDKFVDEEIIVNGIARLNFLFCQTIMNKFPGMEKGEDIELLKQKIADYEKSISILQENLSEAKITAKQKENIEMEMKRLETDMLRVIEQKSEEYENVIDDLRVSMDSFSYKIDNYVEESLGIVCKNDSRDSCERIWSSVTLIISEVKVARSERDEAIEKLERLREINNLVDIKLQEYVEYERKRTLRGKKKRNSLREFFCC